MKKIDTIKTYYESNMGKGLPDYSILGWESEEAQNMRFEILANCLELGNKKLLDVGCGTGNLLSYLANRGIKVNYTGVDILQGMIDLANNKNLEGNFYCVDIFKEAFFKSNSFHVVYASGIFNLNLENNKDFLLHALNLFLDLSKEAVVFNLLHHNSPDKEEQYYYFNPEELSVMLDKLGEKVKKVNLVENYLQNDFTVICYKNTDGSEKRLISGQL
jgi:SAM-dependent methyltransferase